jgi:DNA-binding CsgD family transcriptional regulator
VLKDDPPEQLIGAVRTVAGGGALLSPAITKRVIKQFTRIPRPAAPKELDELIAREQDILQLIADGLSNAEIGQQLYIIETTVKTHVTHIRQKLGLRDRVEAVVLAYQTGLFDKHTPRRNSVYPVTAGGLRLSLIASTRPLAASRHPNCRCVVSLRVPALGGVMGKRTVPSAVVKRRSNAPSPLSVTRAPSTGFPPAATRATIVLRRATTILLGAADILLQSVAG